MGSDVSFLRKEPDVGGLVSDRVRKVAIFLVKLPMRDISVISKGIVNELIKEWNVKYPGKQLQLEVRKDEHDRIFGDGFDSSEYELSTMITQWVAAYCHQNGQDFVDINWLEIPDIYVDTAVLLFKLSPKLYEVVDEFELDGMVVRLIRRDKYFDKKMEITLANFKRQALRLKKTAGVISENIPSEKALAKFSKTLSLGELAPLFVMARQTVFLDDLYFKDVWNRPRWNYKKKIVVARTTDHGMPGVFFEGHLYLLNSNPWTKKEISDVSTGLVYPENVEAFHFVETRNAFHSHSNLYLDLYDSIDDFGHNGSGLCASYAIAIAMVLFKNRIFLDDYSPDVALLIADYYVMEKAGILENAVADYHSYTGVLEYGIKSCYGEYIRNRFPDKSVVEAFLAAADDCIEGRDFDPLLIRNRIGFK